MLQSPLGRHLTAKNATPAGSRVMRLFTARAARTTASQPQVAEPQLLPCVSAPHGFKSPTHRPRVFPHSDFGAAEDVREGLCLQTLLCKRRQYPFWQGIRARTKMLPGRLLQRRRQHQRQPAAPGSTAPPSDYFFIRFKRFTF